MRTSLLLIALLAACAPEGGAPADTSADSTPPDTDEVDSDTPDTSTDTDTDDTVAPDPCAAPVPGSLYATSAPQWPTNTPQPMCAYDGDVLLIANIAALCGYTPQMAGLQTLEESYASQGLRVLGFLSDDFGTQGGTDDDVTQCTEQYATTFATFAKDHVLDPDADGPEAAQPVWTWLLAQPNPGPAASIEPTWNFHKYLIARDGTLVAHWDSSVYPGDDPANPNDSHDTNAIVQAIRAELAR